MKKLNWIIAMMAVAAMVAACDSDDGDDGKTNTTDTTVTDTADTTTEDTTADIAADTTTTTDIAADTTATAAGCTGASDMAYIQSLGADNAKKVQFGEDSKACTLGGCFPGDGTAQTGGACIGKCLVETKGHGLTVGCATCYGIFSYCSAKECLAPCVAGPTSEACVNCQNEKGCTKLSDDCKAGK